MAVNSVTETVKKYSPDLTPLKNACWGAVDLGMKAGTPMKNACWGAYEIGRQAGTPVKNACLGAYNSGSKAFCAVKENGPQMVKKCVPGPESVDKISPYVTHPATKEIIKFLLPGATPAFNIAGALLKDKSTSAHPVLNGKKSEQLSEQLKLTREENEQWKAENERLKAELERNKLGIETQSPAAPAVLKSTTLVAQKPEEVISVFMMKGLGIKDLTANQVVPVREKARL